jgi:hypothetical protein
VEDVLAGIRVGEEAKVIGLWVVKHLLEKSVLNNIESAG